MCNTSDKQFLKISKIYIVIWYHIIIFYNLLINLILPISHMNKYKNTNFYLDNQTTYIEKTEYVLNFLNTYILFRTIFSGISSLAFIVRTDIYNIVMNCSYMSIYSLLNFILNISFINDTNKYKNNMTLYNEFIEMISLREFLNVNSFLNLLVPILCTSIYISAIIYYFVKRRLHNRITPV